eukprot:TRINITY_DN6214_c0_g1_i3.p1 TRINITY_DN6214_c0_g1~~TRINITY_DN6214_c0_g1_i3.p1  ORF type:complete len:234 (-),score=30.73 TRINITY_DN6214_c0_g1_i3:340-1041(-)
MAQQEASRDIMGLRTALNYVAAEYAGLALIVHRVKRFKRNAQERLLTYFSHFGEVRDVVLSFDVGKTGMPPSDSDPKIGNIAFVIMARPEGIDRVLAHGSEHWMGEFYLRVDKFVPKCAREATAEQVSYDSACAPDSSQHHNDATLLSRKEARRTDLDGSFLDSEERKTFNGSGCEHVDSLAASGPTFPDRPQPEEGHMSSLSDIITRYALPKAASSLGFHSMQKENNHGSSR